MASPYVFPDKTPYEPLADRDGTRPTIISRRAAAPSAPPVRLVRRETAYSWIAILVVFGAVIGLLATALIDRPSVAPSNLDIPPGGAAPGGSPDGADPPPVASPPFRPIAGVPAAVNDLALLIAREQRSVVTPGGTPANPGFSADDQTEFDNDPARLKGIVASVKSSPLFAKGVAALKTLPESVRQQALNAFATPLDSTWAMNGHIGLGTTDAGHFVESEIASALCLTVRSALIGA